MRKAATSAGERRASVAGPNQDPSRGRKAGHWTKTRIPVSLCYASTILMQCIGTTNLERVEQCRQGAADVSSAVLRSDSSAGRMPAAPGGHGKLPFCLSHAPGHRTRLDSFMSHMRHETVQEF